MLLVKQMLRAPRTERRTNAGIIERPSVDDVVRYLTQEYPSQNPSVSVDLVSLQDSKTFRRINEYGLWGLLPFHFSDKTGSEEYSIESGAVTKEHLFKERLDIEIYSLSKKLSQRGLEGELVVGAATGNVVGDYAWVLMMDAWEAEKGRVLFEFASRENNYVDVESSSRSRHSSSTASLPWSQRSLPESYNPNDLFKDNIPPVLQDHPYLEVARVFAGKRLD